ncbi:MAG: penicillin-binding protein 2 [Candidatus Deferrimicrobiaceae bacterium]
MKGRIRKREQDPWITSRVRILQGIGLALFFLLLGRLYWLQVVKYEEFQTLSENNRIRIRVVRAPRGVILDRKGVLIGVTQGSYDLIVTPVDVEDLDGELQLLSKVVEFDPGEIREKILKAKEANPYRSITVARDLKFEQVSVVEFNREALSGFSILVEAKRSYPFGPEFAHVLGYVGEASEKELAAVRGEQVSLGDIVGKYGLEKARDDVLRGENGGRQVEVDAAGRDKRLVNEVPPRTGGAIQTTIDSDIQKTAYKGMENRAGAVIAMIPKTGDILAFVSAPAFDPNAFSRGIRKEEWAQLVANPGTPLQNKGLQGTYAPGSTVKPFLALSALETGVQNPKALVRCEGSLTFGDRTFRCWKKQGHGWVDMYKAIVQSCDVYFYTLGLKLNPDRLASLERGVGLGVLTGVELPGEKSGLVPDTFWKREVMKGQWYSYESLLLGIGQGAIHVTPLGMVSAYAAIATGGKVIRPRLVSRVVRMDGTSEEFPPVVQRDLSWNPNNVAVIRRALAGVVNDYGTGGAARLPDIVVGGKTGTAQIVTIKGKMIKTEDLPYEIRDHAWFIGFAPAQDPEICVVALVEHGGHGGSVAAPLVKAVMEEFFRLKQDAEKGGDQ